MVVKDLRDVEEYMELALAFRPEGISSEANNLLELVFDAQDLWLRTEANERRSAEARRGTTVRPGSRLEVDRAAEALGDDPAGGVEAEAGSLADVLGGEERVEYVTADVRLGSRDRRR